MRENTIYRATELAKVLEDEGRKARWLADRVNVSESHLSRVVNGERLATKTLAEQIAEAINKPLFLLFELTKVSDTRTLERVA